VQPTEEHGLRGHYSLRPVGQSGTARRRGIMTAGRGGSGGIRTHDAVPRTPVFKTGAINHSATLPRQRRQTGRCVRGDSAVAPPHKPRHTGVNGKNPGGLAEPLAKTCRDTAASCRLLTLRIPAAGLSVRLRSGKGQPGPGRPVPKPSPATRQKRLLRAISADREPCCLPLPFPAARQRVMLIERQADLVGSGAATAPGLWLTGQAETAKRGDETARI
jgi:hypothetical protein